MSAYEGAVCSGARQRKCVCGCVRACVCASVRARVRALVGGWVGGWVGACVRACACSHTHLAELARRGAGGEQCARADIAPEKVRVGSHVEVCDAGAGSPDEIYQRLLLRRP